MSTDPVPYDEFSYFHENAEEFGLPYDGPPVVRRERVEVEPGRALSALVWGEDEPELVFLHGGAQNAHTWDTVALALGCPLVAIDLPGHGHSDGGRGGTLDTASNAADVAVVIRALAPNARSVIGMSLGGITALALTRHAPELVARLVLVDITPGVDETRTKAITDFVNGPDSFPDFDELLARTIEFNPTRSESSLRRGILHNALQRPDGSWVWRYQRFGGGGERPDMGALWDALESCPAEVLLVRGLRPQSVVSDEDEAEVRRRRPDARIVHVVEAGHSVQGDQPIELAGIIRDFALS